MSNTFKTKEVLGVIVSWHYYLDPDGANVWVWEIKAGLRWAWKEQDLYLCWRQPPVLLAHFPRLDQAVAFSVGYTQAGDDYHTRGN